MARVWLFFAGIFFLFFTRGLFAAGGGMAAIADDAALRRHIAGVWFKETPASVLANRRFTGTLPSGERVEVRAAKSEGGGITVALARERNGAFPGWAAGSWAYTRNAGGEPVRLRFFPRSDPYTFIQIRPFNHNKCQMDIVVYDAYITRAWPIAGSFEHILTKPLNEIFESMDGAPLRYFEPDSDDYRDIRALIRGIRRQIGTLRFEDDGAISKDGEYVYIKTGDTMGKAAGLNCSGFSKWVVDGILRPLTGKRLDVEQLKKPAGARGTAYTAVYEAARDPFFGLDWVRNLAAAAGEAFKSKAFAAQEEIEVRAAPFSSVIERTGRASVDRFYPGFLPEAGFGIEGLGALLYTLAINEPGAIYLGAVNTERGPRPRLRQYFHIIVFAPYFDENGVFHIAQFESAAETAFSRLRARYPAHYVNLVRVPVQGAFDP